MTKTTKQAGCGDINKERVDLSNNTSPSLRRITNSLNKVNLASRDIASPAYAGHPVPLQIDGANVLYRELFQHLENQPDSNARGVVFSRYIAAHFCLDTLEDAGLQTQHCKKRDKLDYRRLLRGWLFSADNRDAAVLKAWAESRFGLRTLYHRGSLLGAANQDAQDLYYREAIVGEYGSNALFAQLDLLYSYIQYELRQRWPGQQALTLYRGINHRQQSLLDMPCPSSDVMVLNNISSFSLSRERADEFGDTVFQTAVPLSKIVMFSGALPGLWQGEDEVLALGGMVKVGFA